MGSGLEDITSNIQNFYAAFLARIRSQTVFNIAARCENLYSVTETYTSKDFGDMAVPYNTFATEMPKLTADEFWQFLEKINGIRKNGAEHNWTTYHHLMQPTMFRWGQDQGLVTLTKTGCHTLMIMLLCNSSMANGQVREFLKEA